MKNFMQSLAAVKAAASLAFTAMIMIVTVISMIFGRAGVPIGYIWQMIFLALIFGLVQLIALSENCFKHMKTPGRMTVIGIAMLAALAIFALIFQWFPTGIPVNWLIFVGLYAAVFLIAVFTLRAVFRLSGVKYNQMLAAFKAGRDRG